MMVINHLQVLGEREEKRRPVSFAAVHVLGGAAWTQAPYGHWVSGVGYLEWSGQGRKRSRLLEPRWLQADAVGLGIVEVWTFPGSFTKVTGNLPAIVPWKEFDEGNW